MKINSTLNRLTTFILLGLSFSLNAQTVSHDFKNTINGVFAGVDLNRVPHHLLTDYAMESYTLIILHKLNIKCGKTVTQTYFKSVTLSIK